MRTVQALGGSLQLLGDRGVHIDTEPKREPAHRGPIVRVDPDRGPIRSHLDVIEAIHAAALRGTSLASWLTM